MNKAEDVKMFCDLFEIVFKDALNTSRTLLKNDIYIKRFFEYPMYDKDFEKSNMPSFTTNFFLSINEDKYLDYSSIFNKYNENDNKKISINSLNGFNDFKSFIIQNQKLKSLFFIESDINDAFLYSFISSFVGKYIYKYGTRYSNLRYKVLLFPIINYLFSEKVDLNITVPILLLRFEKKFFKLNNRIEIIKMSDELQLSRSKAKVNNYSANNIITGCARYALKIKDYYLEYPNNNYLTISSSLKNYTSDILFIIDSFFISIFLETNIYNGYAQIISIPINWMFLIPNGDLINLYIKQVNNYPKHLEDETAWLKDTKIIDTKSLNKIQKLFNIIINCKNKPIELAIDRLCRALLRDNKEDAFLDILIGIEILLTDNEQNEVTYKLSMRIAYIMNSLNKNEPTPRQSLEVSVCPYSNKTI